MKREINMRKVTEKHNFESNMENKSIMSTEGRINTDPFGSYTGFPTENPNERPVQDADDL